MNLKYLTDSVVRNYMLKDLGVKAKKNLPEND